MILRCAVAQHVSLYECNEINSINVLDKKYCARETVKQNKIEQCLNKRHTQVK